jgi:hypothetical protein
MQVITGSNREGMSHPLFVETIEPSHKTLWTRSSFDTFEAFERRMVIEGRLDALRAKERVETERAMSTPPGYRLTAAATDRLDQLAAAFNRRERRALLAHFRRHPIVTFERIAP